MPQLVGDSSGKGVPTKPDKPLPYRPLSLASNGGDARWRKPEPSKETFSGNDRSPKWEPPHTLPNNTAHQQLKDELAELRRMVVRNAQPQAHSLFRITYQKSYLEYVNEHNLFLVNFKMPAFPTFSEEDGNVSSRYHISSSLITVWHLKTIPITS
ncbi:hypothetical protein ACFX19_031517 [Malus domestica]